MNTNVVKSDNVFCSGNIELDMVREKNDSSPTHEITLQTLIVEVVNGMSVN